MSANAETRQVFECGPDELYQAAEYAVEKLGLSVTSRDSDIRRIYVGTDASLASFGENVSIAVEALPNGRSCLTLESGLKVGLNIAGNHRHQKNFEAIIRNVSERVKCGESFSYREQLDKELSEKGDGSGVRAILVMMIIAGVAAYFLFR